MHAIKLSKLLYQKKN